MLLPAAAHAPLSLAPILAMKSQLKLNLQQTRQGCSALGRCGPTAGIQKISTSRRGGVGGLGWGVGEGSAAQAKMRKARQQAPLCLLLVLVIRSEWRSSLQQTQWGCSAGGMCAPAAGPGKAQTSAGRANHDEVGLGELCLVVGVKASAAAHVQRQSRYSVTHRT